MERGMRKIIAGAFTSLDGVMQSPGGPHEDPVGGFQHGGWVAPHFDDRLGQFMGEMFARPFDLLLGRKTYDIFAAHWPYAGEDDPIGPLFNRIQKFVASRNPDVKLTWQNSHWLGSDSVAAVLMPAKITGNSLGRSKMSAKICCTDMMKPISAPNSAVEASV